MQRGTRIVTAVSYAGLTLFAAGVIGWIFGLSPGLTRVPPIMLVGIGLMVSADRIEWFFRQSQ